MWRLCVCDPKFQVMFPCVSNGNHLRNNDARLGGNIIVTSLQMSREKCQYQPIEIIRILHKKKSVPIPSPRTLSSRYPFHDGNSDGNKKSKLIFGKKSSTSPWKLTWQWKKQPFQEMLIFHCHVSFPEGNTCFQTYSSYPTWVWLIGPFWTRSQSCRDVFPA